jgi:predicted kinase
MILGPNGEELEHTRNPYPLAPKTLIMLVGLPRSGKTTAAMTMAAGGGAIVSPDAIRLNLHGQNFYPAAEPLVWAIAQTMVRALFAAGHAIVYLDACNVTKARRAEWKSSTWRRKFVVLDTTREVCIIRAIDENRTDLLPVIERMAEEYEPPSEDEL